MMLPENGGNVAANEEETTNSLLTRDDFQPIDTEGLVINVRFSGPSSDQQEMFRSFEMKRSLIWSC
ncbi:hypothetical protein COCNU_06G002200 [Cocos nucifera]|uniref:Uncharacterized protein n=1 Tax=Cocos nucifera TaxID=13894 RepID=A0A8K0I9V6_COCNU|nr:hypothetical protein COCNU_06G002200 [Cocos nucifera]